MDLVTHFAVTVREKDGICVVVDSATKYNAFIPVHSTDSTHKIAKMVLVQWVLKEFGIPREVISYRDPSLRVVYGRI